MAGSVEPVGTQPLGGRWGGRVHRKRRRAGGQRASSSPWGAWGLLGREADPQEDGESQAFAFVEPWESGGWLGVCVWWGQGGIPEGPVTGVLGATGLAHWGNKDLGERLPLWGIKELKVYMRRGGARGNQG